MRRPPSLHAPPPSLHPPAPSSPAAGAVLSIPSSRLDTEGSFSPMSTSLAEVSHGGHIKEVIAEGPSKRKLAALDPPTSKRRRSPIGLPIVRSPGVRQMISNAIMERSQVAFQERTSNTESPRYRSLSPMTGPLSSPPIVPTQLDAETQTRESTTHRRRLVPCKGDLFHFRCRSRF